MSLTFRHIRIKYCDIFNVPQYVGYAIDLLQSVNLLAQLIYETKIVCLRKWCNKLWEKKILICKVNKM